MSFYFTMLGAALVINIVHIAVTGEQFMITLP